MDKANRKERICSYCDGTGKYKKPNDEEQYERKFDHFADKAYFISMGEAREKALADVGYTLIDCPVCGGRGTRDTAQEA